MREDAAKPAYPAVRSIALILGRVDIALFPRLVG
jgi:hypothetical protein